MLNRRTLRIKAMQTLYAWYRARTSDYFLGEDFIRETFDPVLVASDEAPDRALLKAQETEALELLKNAIEDKEFSFEESVTAPVKSAVIKARNLYRELVDKDLRFLRGQMLLEADKVEHRYLEMLLLFVTLGKWNSIDHDEKKERASRLGTIPTLPSLNLANNKILKRIEELDAFQQLVAKYNLTWDDHQSEVRRWYRESVCNDEAFQAYQSLSSPTIEEDRQILLDLAKSILFKNEAIQEYMEEQDLNWEENRDVVKSMVRKSLKMIPEDGEQTFELIALSPNWEEDRQFFEDLFDITVKEDEYTDQVVADKAKNWEFDRIAATDKIIMKMAVSEMMNFPSVPVKVTINEYIELSKIYSTPKSKQFVNGMLDVIAEDLIKQGVIRKSGRGLIDNK